MTRVATGSAPPEDSDLDELLRLGDGGPLDPLWSAPVHHLVGEHARTHPGDAAVGCGDRALDYGELYAWSGRIAVGLVAAGVRPGDRVVVLVPPSIEMIAAVLGVLRAGAAYVPIDPAQPGRYVDRVLADARPHGAVVSSDTAARLSGRGLPLVHADATAAVDPNLPLPHVGLESAAYIIYTSGSTGEPKGVLVEHRQLAASTAARRVVYPGTPVFLLVSPLAFDSSIAGLWGTLTAGGHLVVATADEMRDPDRLAELVHRHGITRLLCVPSLYSRLLDAIERAGRGPGALDTVAVAGEPLPDALVRRHFAVHQETVGLVNEYGPTETTVWASYHRFDAPAPVSIGGPVPGTRLYVLDEQLRPVQRTVEGELCIGGAGVARGYHGLPRATAEAFVPDPFDGGRMYRTGDRARWNDRGTLDFLGRRDEQVKVRGHRVELGSVEAALRELDGVREAAVVPDGAHARLVAFVRLDTAASPESLRGQLVESLPDFMVPARIHVRDHLPVTINGKVDRARLRAEADRPPAGLSGGAAGAGNGLVAGVTAAWAEALGLADVPIDVNFFDLGGDSLTMFDLQEALARHTGIRPPVVALFRHTTVSAQAELLGNGDDRPRRRQAGKRHPVRTKRTRVARNTISLAARSTLWLHRSTANPQAPQRLVCFPHAGGSAAFYQDWGQRLTEVEVLAVRYPGRGERIDEPAPDDLRRLGREVAEALMPFTDRPLALFGHSMGAAVALETARSLQEHGVEVAHLFASGSRGAPLPAPVEPMDEGDENATAEHLVGLGGTDAELMADPAFRELVLPYILSDGRMFRAYDNRMSPRLRCDVTAIAGDQDLDADLRPWPELTTGTFRGLTVAGDHFYLSTAPPYALIRECLDTGAR